MDKRIKYLLMLDTETANSFADETGKLDLSNSLVYDIGWQVVDKKGRVYESASFVVRDIFFGEKQMMKSAYYAKKIPLYIEEIKAGKRKVANFYEVRKQMLDTMEKYGIKTVCAHNARFDLNALNITQRWLTKSAHRYFFPYGTEIWDTLKMASDTIGKQKSYISWCERNEYMTTHKTPRPRLTAEILYRYISGNNEFDEAHTGLEDVEIETKILAHCFRQHKKMRKNLFEKSSKKA